MQAPSHPLSKRQRRVLLWAEVVRMGAVLLLIVFVYFTSVKGRSDLVRSVRDGCERTQARIALIAHAFSAQGDERLARALYGTEPADCAEAYPDPGPLPFGGTLR